MPPDCRHSTQQKNSRAGAVPTRQGNRRAHRQQLLEQFKVANAKYEQLVELVKEQEGVEQSATEVVE